MSEARRRLLVVLPEAFRKLDLPEREGTICSPSGPLGQARGMHQVVRRHLAPPGRSLS